ncbi:MAG: asparagine synthase C-terminal domain-containing protein [Thermoplasmata archaeon]
MDASEMLAVLRTSVRNALQDTDRAAVAYSGGLDSSVLAHLAGEECEIVAYTCALHRSFDAANSTVRAREEGLKHILVKPSREEFCDAVKLTAKATRDYDPTRIAYTLPLVVVVNESSQRVVLAGNGADELFGGYARYLTAADPRGEMRDDLEKARTEAALIQSWAASEGKSVRFPYLDPVVVQACAGLEFEQLISGGQRKVILTETARLLGLASHAFPKKAAQYSSGVLREMRRLARQESLTLSEWTRKVVEGDSRST